MEPARQVEIQLGHMCNNRCVFCVSGQRTGLGEAGPLPVEPILERVSEAHQAGHRKLTLLGGEPTLQPGFMEVVRHAVALGFEEIVIFTNGVKTARAGLIDEVLATGGSFTWRISIQGATEEAHVSTTRRPNSFKRILRSIEHLKARGERLTINMCVVESNYASVPAFVDLVEQSGAVQLHLDMMRPLDAGDRTPAEMRDMLPRLSDLRAPFAEMIAGFEARMPGFDVNIGNLPYCIAPELAPWIHHDGNFTETIAIDGDDRLSKPWNKYLVKRRDKIKPERCRECLFDDACSGVFETYAQYYGTDELQPIDPARLLRADPERRLLARHLRPLATKLRGSGFETFERGEAELLVQRGESRFRLARTGQSARYAAFAVDVLDADAETTRTLADALRDEDPIHPLGEDFTAARTVQARLRRLRAAAPFGALTWTSTHVANGRAELRLEAGDCGAILWLDENEGRATGGYEPYGDPSDALIEGLREAMAALRIETVRETRPI